MSQDLTDVFGAPATSSLRGLLPHRGDGARQAEPPVETATPPEEQAPSEAPAAEEDAPADTDTDAGMGTVPPASSPAATGRRTTRTTRTTRTGANAPFPPRAAGTNRRWGTARVSSQDHVDLLVLLALRQGPTDGRGVIARLRESSGGALEAPAQTIYTTVRRLVRGRLLERTLREGSARQLYALTEAGERATRARLREWSALSRAVDAVSRAGDPT